MVMRRLSLDFSHAPLARAELLDLREGWKSACLPYSYDWPFYERWFGGRPSDAPEHMEMDAMVTRVIDVTETVLLGGIPWNLEFARAPEWLGGSGRWSIMLRGGPGSGYSYGVSLGSNRKAIVVSEQDRRRSWP